MTQSQKPKFGLAVLAGIAIPILLFILFWVVWSATRTKPFAVDRGDGLSFRANFQQPLDELAFKISDFAFESDFIKTGFVRENVRQNGSDVTLSLDRRPVEYHPYSGAEVQKRGFYHYGRYEAVMRAAPGSGTVSSFFTHTNDVFGDPHDEIDFEFLGRDPHMVSLNYFSNGVAAGTVEIPLPYDASASFHLYAFEWSPASIKWYIDGTLVHTETGRKVPIPSAPSRVIFNLWSGSEKLHEWHGKPTFDDGSSAAYKCISFRAFGDDAQQCSDIWSASSKYAP